MGTKSTTQTQSSSSAPWAAAQPALQTSLDAARSLYSQGVGSQPYTGSTVVPYADQTIQGLDTRQNNANQAQGLFDSQAGRVGEMASQGGLSDLQRQSASQLNPMASGAMLEKNNPFTNAVVNRSADVMGNQVNEAFSGMGRYGSGKHAGALADSVGGMASQAYQGDYNNERGYMQDAIGSLANLGQQQRQNIAGDTSSLMDAFTATQAPGRELGDIGSYYEDLNMRRKNDELRIFDAQQNAPWEAVNRLAAAGSLAGSLGGSKTGQATTPGPSRAQGALGGAIAGSPYGLGGAGLGALLGLV